ncbi:Pyruvate/2-oxoglutarate/acetoin dehydrogenase complex, dehydrogenase (E1) component [Saccharicrinis carchari]|uniref:3-methyl-2-oxobutanoate dehydrogenase (2-methylpropanoyl-transferring) n=1 Tax=Saccharicrinis carchari TaxID=1168039 RepID=A0A521EJM6_SACCC|nr:alpha-ketoacid dehydrogenase subunit alpha/beta [Saccharicrinis carchari]SMO84104.1 Pyruvate/2-oxoglutarate/acetoin dehydrogenase complex, dehydrogenase (E1) component [Saccharicrinis carchari]
MTSQSGISFHEFKKEVLEDYRIAHLSRNLSLLGRKEVLGGKAKFGIFGDGKELAQIAMAKQFKKGDWRSGYYRDQTFMLAAGMTTPMQFFAALYGQTDTDLNPDNGGRSFNNHFGTRIIKESGQWKNIVDIKCTSSDISPTGGQMPRLLGLALASKLYRNNPAIKNHLKFSRNGNEVAFGTIGDSSTSEGHFFETMNAAAVHQIPMAVSVWDDGYGISVPKHLQTAKNSISDLLKGFEKGVKDTTGILIYKLKGWDYAGLCQVYQDGIARCRKEHVPVLFHIEELTQPIGHSTSGSHERYKSAERLQWEKEFDCLLKMKEWMIERSIASATECEQIEEAALGEAQEAQKNAWEMYSNPLNKERDDLIHLIETKSCVCSASQDEALKELISSLKGVYVLNRKEILSTARKIARHLCTTCAKENSLKQRLQQWIIAYKNKAHIMYNNRLYAEDEFSTLKVSVVPPHYADDTVKVPGREILRDNFDALFAKIPQLVSFGEDTGTLGGVNQSMEGLQKKYGTRRIWDEGIRETSIIGTGLGLALRGFRPIAEIQYFDYLMYGLQTISDDLATLRYRTKGGQKAPMIVRTRGHRLEGIWHSGSPTSMVINSIRGVYVCVPRDMTRAAGMYNTLLQGDDPGLVIEPLNAYRVREPRPDNIGEFTVPLGIPEVLQQGTHVTVVTYGSCVRIAQEAVQQLNEVGISVELIDVQTLLPFDIHGVILHSIKKTNRVVFFDEDVPGGTTAYMMQQVLEKQGGFKYLDSEPQTVTGKDHRPAFGTDGDYFSNPNAEDLYEAIYGILSEFNPDKYPPIY